MCAAPCPSPTQPQCGFESTYTDDHSRTRETRSQTSPRGGPRLTRRTVFTTQEETEEGARSNRVLVMCPSGMSASATVLGSYLICKKKLPLAVCMAKLREAHPAVEPNKGFARHLRFLERNGELPEWSKP